MQGEKYITYNPGINDFLEMSCAKNYIVSGGLREFLQNLETAKHFKGIYGTLMQHNKSGLISGIGEVMTDEKKILAICDILRKNNRQEMDCRNVYFIGDGYTDAPAMEFVHNNGGKVIFVHQPNENDDLASYNNQIYEKLNKNGMIDFCCVADYRDGSMLFNILQRKN